MVRRLLLLNGLAAVLAVTHHSVNWVLTAMFWWTDRYMVTSIPNYARLGGAEFYGLRLTDQFASPAVCVFLFVSGYFVSAAAGHSEKLSWPIVISRIKGLLPPYALWSLVAIVLNVINGETYSASRFAWVLLVGGAAAPFYYVPLLVKLYVLSPWLVPLARHHWKPLLIMTGLVQLCVAIARSSIIVGILGLDDSPLLRPLINSHLAAYSFWFASGLVVGFHVAEFKAMVQRIRPALPWAMALVGIGAFVEWEVLRRWSGRPWIAGDVTVLDNMFSLTLLLAFFAYEKVNLPCPARLSQIGTMSYGIYLMHTPILEILARGIYHGVPKLLAYPSVLQLLLIVAGVGAPVLLMKATKASPLRRYYAYAFG